MFQCLKQFTRFWGYTSMEIVSQGRADPAMEIFSYLKSSHRGKLAESSLRKQKTARLTATTKNGLNFLCNRALVPAQKEWLCVLSHCMLFAFLSIFLWKCLFYTFITLDLLNSESNIQGLCRFIIQLQITHLFRVTSIMNNYGLDYPRVLRLESDAETEKALGYWCLREAICTTCSMWKLLHYVRLTFLKKK